MGRRSGRAAARRAAAALESTPKTYEPMEDEDENMADAAPDPVPEPEDDDDEEVQDAGQEEGDADKEESAAEEEEEETPRTWSPSWLPYRWVHHERRPNIYAMLAGRICAVCPDPPPTRTEHLAPRRLQTTESQRDR